MTPDNKHDRLLIGFISLSLLVHLVFIRLTPLPQPRIPEKEEPVYVEMAPQKKTDPDRPRPAPEMDAQELPELQKPRETPAKRLATLDQVVEKEKAPKGEAEEDQRPDSQGREVQTLKKPTYTAPAAQPSEAVAAEKHKAPEAPLPAEAAKPVPAQAPAQEAVAAATDLQSLLQLPDATRARLESDWKRKYRKDVEEGNAVWLDTESDLLFSFFNRFRNNIYAVWNYPGSAARRGEDGSCLLQIQINRDGSVRSVKLLESTGFDILDKEAMGAVRRGASYGPLPRAYTEPYLTIMAVFKYNLSMSAVRGGTIY